MNNRNLFGLIWSIYDPPAGRAIRRADGFVLTAALMLVLLGAVVIGSLFSVSRQTVLTTKKWRQYDECLLAAQSALEKVKADIYEGFRAEHAAKRSWDDLAWVVDHAGDYSARGTVEQIVGAGALSHRAYAAAQVRVEVSSGAVVGVSPEEREVVLTNRATVVWGGISRALEEVVRYKLNRSSVFDHAYFINNFGWFHGVDCVVNGNIRSNYDVELLSWNLVLNGHSYAAGVNDLRKPYQTWPWNTYRSNGRSERFRPLYHVDMNARNKQSLFAWGYKDSGRHNYVSQLEMPIIGNLNDYKYYAQGKKGTIRQKSGLLVQHVFDGVGPSGIRGAADQGCLYLRGTREDPIVIDGPVVVEGDLILEGYFTGKGTLYAGRNIHVINSVIALDPPRWKHPDSARQFREKTLPDNLGKDFLGLVARGSVVLGDPALLNRSFRQYLKPPFTSAYAVSATDADIGYVSYQRDGKSFFDGDYTARSGSRCASENPAQPVARAFYEPSVSALRLASYNPAPRVGHLDAFIYNNHLTTGYLGSNSMINGGIICRDEALMPAGRMYMNWDPRVAMDSDFTPFLPMELGPAETISWREVAP